MSDEFTVVNHDTQTTRVEDSRSDAETRITEAKRDFGFTDDDLEMVVGAFENYDDVETATTDGGPEVVEESTTSVVEDTSGNAVEDVAEKDIGTDPLNVMPAHFVDDIQGVPTINRKGYCVLAEHYGISVESEPVTLPSETGFEYAEFTATATTDDGTTYSGFGSAHVDRKDGDDKHLLAELAETRAMKRAVAWATGVGMTAQSEMRNSL